MDKDIETILIFLHGMYYGGNMPSLVEIRDIARYLQEKKIIEGSKMEMYGKVAIAMETFHENYQKEQ